MENEPVVIMSKAEIAVAIAEGNERFTMDRLLEQMELHNAVGIMVYGKQGVATKKGITK